MAIPFYPIKYVMEKKTQSYFCTRADWYITYGVEIISWILFGVFCSLKNDLCFVIPIANQNFR